MHSDSYTKANFISKVLFHHIKQSDKNHGVGDGMRVFTENSLTKSPPLLVALTSTKTQFFWDVMLCNWLSSF